MYEMIMEKIETTYKNRQEAFAEIKKAYNKGLLAKVEFTDCMDYARYTLDNNGKIKRGFGY